MAIAQNTAGTSATTVYTSTNTSAITAIFLMNDDASTVTIQIYVVANGETASASNKIIKDLSILASDTYVFDTEKLILDNGDTIQVSASTGSVVHVTTSYIGV